MCLSAGRPEAMTNGLPPAAPSEAKPATHQGPKLSATAQFQMEAALQKDAFLVFRALCKLSVRASETAAGTDMTAIRGKVSSLHPAYMMHFILRDCPDEMSKCL